MFHIYMVSKHVRSVRAVSLCEFVTCRIEV